MIMKASRYDLLNLPIKEGQIYFLTDNWVLYKDYGNTINQRSLLPAMVINTDSERLNKIRPVNGVNYYVVETNSLWCFDARWVLKDGDTSQYNTYTYSGNNAMSPVIINDEYIQTEAGDRIIDNNGLLGDGSVVIRDDNRIRRGMIRSSVNKRRLELTSYLDNGIVIRPFGTAISDEDRDNVGSLSLNVDLGSWSNGAFVGSLYKGVANYKGDLNIDGDMKVNNVDAVILDVNALPQSINEKITVNIRTLRTDDGETTRNVIKINVIDDTHALTEIRSYTVQSDSIVPDGNEALVYRDGIKYETVRTKTDDGVTYKLLGVNKSITVTSEVQGDNTITTCTFDANTWSDDVKVPCTIRYHSYMNVSEEINALKKKIKLLEEKLS